MSKHDTAEGVRSNFMKVLTKSARRKPHTHTSIRYIMSIKYISARRMLR